MTKNNNISGFVAALIIVLGGFGALADSGQTESWNEAEVVATCAAGAGPIPTTIFNMMVDYCAILEVAEEAYQKLIETNSENTEFCGENSEPVLILIFDLLVDYCTLHDQIEDAKEASTSQNS